MLDYIPDHPVIRDMERRGSFRVPVVPEPSCPVCGRECETAFIDKWGVPLGCEYCVGSRSAWDCGDYLRGGAYTMETGGIF